VIADLVYYQYYKRDALISQIYFWNKTLHVSDSSSVHHQKSSTVQTAIGICHTSYADCLLASSRHTSYADCLLASSYQTIMTYTCCCVHSEKFLMMDRGTVRNT